MFILDVEKKNSDKEIEGGRKVERYMEGERGREELRERESERERDRQTKMKERQTVVDSVKVLWV